MADVTGYFGGQKLNPFILIINILNKTWPSKIENITSRDGRTDRQTNNPGPEKGGKDFGSIHHAPDVAVLEHVSDPCPLGSFADCHNLVGARGNRDETLFDWYAFGMWRRFYWLEKERWQALGGFCGEKQWAVH
jgi:hypothetical protein